MTRQLTLPRLAALALAASLIAPAFADREVVSVDAFLAALDDVRAQLQEGDPRRLDEDEWREFDKIEEQFERVLSDVETIDELNGRQKTKVFNLQEEMDTLLVGRREEQVVCTERKQLGSRIARRDCVTIGQREAERDRALRILGDIPSVMRPPAGR